MLIKSKRCQAEELPQIYASRVTIVKLQKSMREEEQRRRNSPKLGRRRWNSGERAEGGPISQQCCEEKRWRRRHRQGCWASSSVGTGVEQDGSGVPSLSFGPVMKRKGQRSGGRRRHCGGKKSKFTPTPVFIPKDQGRGDHGSAPLPRPFPPGVATWRHGMGRRLQ
jgi:hypothetical protein